MTGPLPRDLAHTLAQKLRDGQLVLFAGAGLSMQAKARDGSARRMPGWDRLLQQVAERFGESIDDYRDEPLGLFDAIIADHQRAVVEQAVRDAIDDSAFEPGPTHDAMRQIAWNRICTTNYDTLLDQCLNTSPVTCEPEYDRLGQPPAHQPRLFKLHGSLANPHTLTGQDYQLWPDKHPRAFRFVEDLLLNRTILFVGYSLSDPHWKALIPLVQRMLGTRTKRLYALVWRANERRRQNLLRQYNVEAASIDTDADYAAAFRQIEAAYAVLRAAPIAAPSDPAAFAYDRRQYEQAAQRTYGYAELQGLYHWGAGFARDDVGLADIFVEPDLTLTEVRTIVADPADADADEAKGVPPASALRQARERRRREADTNPDVETRTVATITRQPAGATLAAQPRLLIVGAPGQGKSTLLRHQLLAAVRHWCDDQVGRPFPFLVRLSRWQEEAGAPEGRLLRFMRARLPGFAEISAEATAAWQAGPMLWLLDGIDEIRGEAARADFLADLIRLAGQRPNDRFVVTTRPAGEPRGGLGAGWVRCELPELSPPQITEVLGRWATVLHRKEGLAVDAAAMGGQLARDPGLRQVRANALMLTMAILFYKQNHRLPHDRWEFYTGAEQALRDAWARHRATDLAARDLPGAYAVEVLEDLALQGMRAETVLFPEAEVREAAERALRAHEYRGRELEEETNRFMAAARDAIGVLVEQGPAVFGFLHLTFQEFLAARAITRLALPAANEVVAGWWDHPDWQETWTLYALGCEAQEGRSQALFATILARGSRHHLDRHLHRPERMALRLAAVGSRSLPDSAQPAIAWATRAVTAPDRLWRPWVLAALTEWERSEPANLRAALVAAWKDDNPDIRYAAVQALAGRAEDATVRAALLAACKDDDRTVRHAAMQALAARAEDATVRAALLAACKDGNWRARQAAVQALAVCAEDATVRAALLAASKDDDGDVRQAAVQALAARAEDATVRTALLAATKDADADVREAAVQALAACAEDATVRAALLAACKDGDWLVRRPAVQALAARAEDAMVRAALLAACKDADEDARRSAVQALAGRAEDATVRAALLAACKDDHPAVRRAAMRALNARADDATVRAALFAACKDADADVRHAAVQALAVCADDATVRAALLAACKDADELVRQAAVWALAARADDAAVCAALLTACKDDLPFVRHAAAHALAARAEDATVGAALLAACEDADEQVRQAAVWALAWRAEDATVRAALLAACTDPNEGVRQAAVRALAGCAGDATVRAALLAAFKDVFPRVRHAAVQALAGRAADVTVRAALVAACQDGDADVRQAAVQALEDWIVRQKFPRPVAAGRTA